MSTTPVLVRHPVVDPKTSLVTPEWANWFQALSALIDAVPAVPDSGDSFADLTKIANAVLVTDADGVPSFSTQLPLPVQLAILTLIGASAPSTTEHHEAPTGAIDGANAVYAVTTVFLPGSTQVYQNGLRQRLGTDYTESGAAAITMTTPPTAGDLMWVDYEA